MTKFEQYEHHGQDVWVRTSLLGDHRSYCLCHDCDHFHPAERASNCLIANTVFSLCQLQGLVLPVWECPEFEEIEIGEGA